MARYVEVKTVEKWLLYIAEETRSIVVDGNSSAVCEILAENIDKLRSFGQRMGEK